MNWPSYTQFSLCWYRFEKKNTEQIFQWRSRKKRTKFNQNIKCQLILQRLKAIMCMSDVHSVSSKLYHFFFFFLYSKICMAFEWIRKENCKNLRLKNFIVLMMVIVVMGILTDCDILTSHYMDLLDSLLYFFWRKSKYFSLRENFQLIFLLFNSKVFGKVYFKGVTRVPSHIFFFNLPLSVTYRFSFRVSKSIFITFPHNQIHSTLALPESNYGHFLYRYYLIKPQKFLIY